MRYIRFPLGCVMGCLLFLCSCNDSRQSEVLQQALKKAGVKVTLESDSPLASTFPVLVSPAPVTSVGAPPSNKPSAAPSPLATTIVPTPIPIPSSTPTPLPRPEDITYDVSTVAGRFIVDVLQRPQLTDGSLAKAHFGIPIYLTISKENHIYVVDSWTTIRKVILSPSSSHVTTLAGSKQKGFVDGVGAQAKFNNISGMVEAPQGGLYVSDLHSIRHIAVDGQVTTVIGDASPGYQDGPKDKAKLNTPTGLAINWAGELYIADSGNHRIRKLSTDGQLTTVAGNGQIISVDGSSTQASFTALKSLAFDSKNNLYILDDNRIRRLSPERRVTTNSLFYHYPWPNVQEFQGRIIDTPEHFVIGPDEQLYVSDNGSCVLWRIKPMKDYFDVYLVGGLWTKGRGSGACGSNLDESINYILDGNALDVFLLSPQGLAFDSQRNLLLADAGSQTIRKLTPKPIKSSSP